MSVALSSKKLDPPMKAPAQFAGDAELTLDFITESCEHLADIEAHMLLLERAARAGALDDEALEMLNTVFRAFHTIKGLAGFLDFDSLRSIAHEVESLLDGARKGTLQIDSAIVDAVLQAADAMHIELDVIAASLAGGPSPVSEPELALLTKLRQLSDCAEQSTPQAVTSQQERSEGAPDPTNNDESLHAKGLPIDLTAQRSTADTISPTPPRVGAPTLRIETGKLDLLMNLVGEMLIAQTIIMHNPALESVNDSRLMNDLTSLTRTTRRLQRLAAGMRMVPIGTQFQKTARMIRDLSQRAGKQIMLTTSGEETEVDKKIAEEIADPLLHMVRNAVDHGVEPSDQRVALGKPPIASIKLAAYHEAGQIVISISDDGRGLRKERIFAKAVERGLIQADAQLTENEIFLLIFEPGFSTADSVTDISGRGVGMDVVRRKVQGLRGSIRVESVAGQGTAFLIHLPLTLALIEGLVVLVGDQRYIAPVFQIGEIFQATCEMISATGEGTELVTLRDRLLPVLRLHEQFEKASRTVLLSEGRMIICECGQDSFCLFVDDVIGKQEVVTKGLGAFFEELVRVTGCAILGDGHIGLILDLPALYRNRRRCSTRIPLWNGNRPDYIRECDEPENCTDKSSRPSSLNPSQNF